MKALMVTNESVTRRALLEMAEKVPGAWIGLRIAAILLLLRGWTSTQVAELFEVSRWSMVKWIHSINDEGIYGLKEKKRPGRPCRLNKEVQRELEKALEKDPKELGLSRSRWDGIVVVEYLKTVHGIRLQVRQAQRWIRRLGFSLRRPIYRYVQAMEQGVEEFRQTIKKTPDGKKQ
jgi:transposase